MSIYKCYTDETKTTFYIRRNKQVPSKYCELFRTIPVEGTEQEMKDKLKREIRIIIQDYRNDRNCLNTYKRTIEEQQAIKEERSREWKRQDYKRKFKESICEFCERPIIQMDKHLKNCKAKKALEEVRQDNIDA